MTNEGEDKKLEQLLCAGDGRLSSDFSALLRVGRSCTESQACQSAVEADARPWAGPHRAAVSFQFCFSVGSEVIRGAGVCA